MKKWSHPGGKLQEKLRAGQGTQHRQTQVNGAGDAGGGTWTDRRAG